MTAMLELRGVCKDAGGKRVLSDIDMTLRDGMITVLLGGEGSGKTLLCDIVTGLVNADAGSVKLNGREYNADDASAKRSIGYVPQDVSVFRDMTPATMLRFAGQTMEISSHVLNDRLERAMKQTGLKEVSNLPIKKLGDVYLQRLTLARAMLGDADVIVLDCPERTGDTKQILEFRNMLRETVKGKTVLLATDSISDACAFGDRVYVLDGGRIVGATDMKALADMDAAGEWTSIRVCAGATEAGKALEGAKLEYKTVSEEDGMAVLEVKTGRGYSARGNAVKALVGAGIAVVGVCGTTGTLDEIIAGLKSVPQMRETAGEEGAEA